MNQASERLMITPLFVVSRKPRESATSQSQFNKDFNEDHCPRGSGNLEVRCKALPICHTIPVQSRCILLRSSIYYHRHYRGGACSWVMSDSSLFTSSQLMAPNSLLRY